MSLFGNKDQANNAPLYSVLSGLGSDANSEVLYANTTVGVFVDGIATGVFGVSEDEMQGIGNLTSITVLDSGAGFNVRPTIAISGANTTQATANANAIVVSATVYNAGGKYANNDILTLAGGTGSSANLKVTNVTANGNVIAVAVDYAGDYTALPNLVNCLISANTSANGSGFAANVVYGLGSVEVTTDGAGYSSPVVTISGYGPNSTPAVVVANLTGQEGTDFVTHTGWNLRVEGSGGRAGRVFYETLVAGGIEGGDDSDDTIIAP